jgi:hypothetical protein
LYGDRISNTISVINLSVEADEFQFNPIPAASVPEVKQETVSVPSQQDIEEDNKKIQEEKKREEEAKARLVYELSTKFLTIV